nr:MAG TPA: hypothetical protein [Caudoviricetes sp.]
MILKRLKRMWLCVRIIKIIYVKRERYGIKKRCDKRDCIQKMDSWVSYVW